MDQQHVAIICLVVSYWIIAAIAAGIYGALYEGKEDVYFAPAVGLLWPVALVYVVVTGITNGLYKGSKWATKEILRPKDNI